jgi:hypothetical protein
VCVCARVIVWCDGSGERGAGRHVPEVVLGLRECEEWLCHRRDVECASWVCIAGAVSSAVSRALCRSIAIADLCVVACALLHRVSLWLVCDCAALRGIVSAVDCSCVCVSLRARVHYRCVAVGVVLRCACVVGGCGGRWQSVHRTSATRVLCGVALL